MNSTDRPREVGAHFRNEPTENDSVPPRGNDSLTIKDYDICHHGRPAIRLGTAARIEHMSTTTDRTTEMGQPAPVSVATLPTITDDTRAHLGIELRSIYADLCDTQPITDAQVDLLLRMRHKERDRRRAA